MARELEQRRLEGQARKAEEIKERQRKMDAERNPPQVAPTPSDAAATTLPVIRSTPPRPIMTPRALPSAAASPAESVAPLQEPTPATTKPSLPVPPPIAASPAQPTTTSTPPGENPDAAKKDKKDKKVRRPLQPGEKPEAEADVSPEESNQP